MTTTVRRIVSSCFVLSVAAGLAIPAPAQAQYGQHRAAEGSHVWAEDGWCYVVQGGRLVRTGYRRVFPDRTNRAVFDIYENGRFLRRVVASPQPAAGNRQTGSPEAQLQRLINQLNQQVGAAQGRTPTPTSRGTAAGVPHVLAANCPAVTGPFIAPNVRVTVPWAEYCQTPEEKRFGQKNTGDTLIARTIAQNQVRCENARVSQPWVHKYRGADGVMVYRHQDGSEHRQGGSLPPGWYWGATGPQWGICR